MSAVTESVWIDAPQEEVFRKGSDLPHCEEWIEEIIRIELLTEGPVGTGTRWRETRMMFGKQSTEEMSITRFEPPQMYQAEAYNCGSQYITQIHFAAENGGTKVTSNFNCVPQTFFAKIMVCLTGWMMKGMLRKMLLKDMTDLKSAVEADAAS
ncbi:Polyketide cyclase / dehydrase and lipid transport [Polystyrenella longa]|uniref:Polyketide cyclase / dehydrase and lipid transport n=1 Tax=Polystyrenella longa TaxID=2528007 RepID=A0A518CSC0_9PLAN|nr:SRPBCC family protein [Polystyrenella longa]QDU82127.1 Polyketide cyclase / dehydrase and lipid transport [Polystyrenella longa]